MKKLYLLLSILIIVISFSGCKSSNDASLKLDDLSKVDEKKEVTIIMSKHNTMNLDDKYEQRVIKTKEIESYTKAIELVRTDFINITDNALKYLNTISNVQEEYLQNRNAQLYLENGPELILISGGEDYENLIKQDIALNIEDKIPNYKKIYKNLRDGYFVPISMAVDTVVLNKRAFNNSPIELPDINWSQVDFYSILLSYYENLGMSLRPEIVYLAINSELNDYKFFPTKSKEPKLANEDMVKKIENIRHKLLETKRFRLVKDFKYEDYYEMMYYSYEEWMDKLAKDKVGFGVLHKDFEKIREEIFTENPIINLWGSTNVLNPLETNNNKEKYISDHNKGSKDNNIQIIKADEDIRFLPRSFPTYSSWGFIVNKNGKNIEEALKFLDMLLMDEIQLKIYKELDDKHNSNKVLSFTAPVIETIEDEIRAIENEEEVNEELINLRNVVLNQIKEGKRTRNYRGASYRGAYVIDREEPLTEEQERFFKEELEKLIIKVVFADERYSSEKIMKELRELENRLMIIFNE